MTSLPFPLAEEPEDDAREAARKDAAGMAIIQTELHRRLPRLEKLLEHYPKLSTTERATVLRAIGNNDIKTFRKLAPDALASNNSSLISAACTTLQQDASPEAVAMLVKAFDSTNSSTALNYIANALSAVGTPEARKVLETARSDKNANKRNYANNALRTLMQRSPGYQYISMGRHYSQQLDWKQALTQYNLAIKIDPRHSAAYAGRGNARLSHRMADLVESDHHVARSEQPGHAGFEMVVHQHAVLFADLGPAADCQFRTHQRSKRGIDAVECHAARASVEGDPAILDRIAAARARHSGDPRLVQRLRTLYGQVVVAVR